MGTRRLRNRSRTTLAEHGRQPSRRLRANERTRELQGTRRAAASRRLAGLAGWRCLLSEGWGPCLVQRGRGGRPLAQLLSGYLEPPGLGPGRDRGSEATKKIHPLAPSPAAKGHDQGGRPPGGCPHPDAQKTGLAVQIDHSSPVQTGHANWPWSPCGPPFSRLHASSLSFLMPSAGFKV